MSRLLRVFQRAEEETKKPDRNPVAEKPTPDGDLSKLIQARRRRQRFANSARAHTTRRTF